MKLRGYMLLMIEQRRLFHLPTCTGYVLKAEVKVVLNDEPSVEMVIEAPRPSARPFPGPCTLTRPASRWS